MVNRKPHPEVYLTPVERLGLPIEKCIVFEDSFAGIRSALSAGLPVVGIASGHSKKELLQEGVALAVDDFTLLSLNQITALINQD